MSLRYIGLLIGQAREETGETDYSDSADPNEVNGVPQSVPVQAAREAVIHCQNSLYLASPQIFDIISEIDAVVGQIEYDMPENAYLGAAVASAEYSESGDDEDFSMLSLSDYAYRTGGSGIPSRFIPYNDGKVLFDPAPSTQGLFRIVHGADLDMPDLRRGKISSVTKDGPMTNYLTIVLDSTDATLDEDAINANEYVCVNDKDGVVKHYNVAFTAYDSTTKTLTLDTSTAVADGAISVGDYITVGKFTTTHIKLHNIAEPVVLAFLRRRFYLGKSSVDVQNEEDNIAAFTKEMVSAYRRRVRVQKKIPFIGRFEHLGRTSRRSL